MSAYATAQGEPKPLPPKVLLLAALMVFGLWWQIRHVDRLALEWSYRADFRPAADARIASAKCETRQLGALYDCDFVVARDSGPTMTISDMGFGSAPAGRVVLLAHPAVPGSCTTNASLASLNTRMAFAMASIAMGLLGIVGIILSLVRWLRPKY